MMKRWIIPVVSAVFCVGTLLANEIKEDFDPGKVGSTIDPEQAKSVTTGYRWSGYQGNLWELTMVNDPTPARHVGKGLDFSGHQRNYDGVNAWTIFNGDAVKGLRSIVFQWSPTSNSYNMEVQALICDAKGNWYVSDDMV